MALKESEAIILRSYPLGEADRLVSFLTRQYGRMRGVAPGAKRTKTAFGGSLEPLTYVRMSFAERETRDLVRLRHCDILESFLAGHGDYECSVALGMIAEITDAVLPEREPSDPAFRLVLLCAREIQKRRAIQPAVLYFLLWTVRIAGWLPLLRACARCERNVAAEGAYASAVHPSLLCRACRLPGMRHFTAEELGLAERMLREKLDDVAAGFSAGKGAGLQAFLLDLVEHQIERKLKTRTAMESIR
jgi:DNA repair protein RecO (recombination protein O)